MSYKAINLGGNSGGGKSNNSVIDNTTSEFTQIQLNTKYPIAGNDFRVICPNINGGTTYQKLILDDGTPTWISFLAGEIFYGETLFSKVQGKGIWGWGNSILAHQGVALEDSFIYKLNQKIGGVLNNFAVPGNRIGDQLPLMVKNISIGREYLPIWAVGINDRAVDYNNIETAPLIPQYAAQTFLLQAFAATSVPATDPSVTKVGAWADVTSAKLNNSTKYVGLESKVINDYVEFAFTGENVFYSIAMQGRSPNEQPVLSQYRIYIDGTLQRTHNGFNTLEDSPYYYNFSFWLNGLTNDDHVIRIVNNSDNGTTTDRSAVIIEFGTIKSPNDAYPAIVSTIYPMDIAIAGVGLNAQGLINMNLNISAAVQYFIDLGFPVALVRYLFYTAAADQTQDGLHPNGSTGSLKILQDYQRDVPFLQN